MEKAMSIFSKLMENFNMNSDEDEGYLDDDYEDEDDFDDAPQKSGFFSKRSSYETKEQPKKPGFLSRGNVIPMKHADGGMQVTMIKPTGMDDSREICDNLLDGKAVVLNMEGMNTEIAQRIIDFTSGATYSMGGNLQMISKFIFIATPESVELSGDFQDIFGGGTTGSAAARTNFNGMNFNV